MWLPHIAPNLQSLLEFRLDCGQSGSNPFLGATSVWPVALSETKKTPSQERDADIPIQTTEQAN
jgi:hypothetical protein